MKKLLLAGVATGAVLAAGGAVFAADPIPVVVPPVIIPPVVEAPYDWTGFHVGVTGGLAVRQFTFPFAFQITTLNDVEEEVVITGEGAARTSAGGFTAGIGAGYNFQVNNIVFGIEGDFNWTNFASFVGFDVTATDGVDTFEAEGEAFARVNWFATLRGRVGFATGHDGRFLPYVTGGLAYGKTTLGIDVDIDGFVIDETLDPFKNLGWTVGAGFEYAFTDTLSFKTEYLFVSLGTENLVVLEDEETGDFFELGVTTRFHTLRAGFNWNF